MVQPRPDGDTVRKLAVEQFTVHAESFGSSPVMNDDDALADLARLCALRPGDRVLDVACGPGIVSCRLAAGPAGATVIGIDATPAMVGLATERAAGLGVAGQTGFLLGYMEQLPFRSGCFDVVVSRYALHHAADPAAVAVELARVVRPGGAVVVFDFDAGADIEAARAYDEAERWRDPSHVRNLSADEQRRVLTATGLQLDGTAAHRLHADLDTVLARSHGVDHARVRALFEASLTGHRLGVGAQRVGDRITFAYPICGSRFRRPVA